MQASAGVLAALVREGLGDRGCTGARPFLRALNLGLTGDPGWPLFSANGPYPVDPRQRLVDLTPEPRPIGVC